MQPRSTGKSIIAGAAAFYACWSFIDPALADCTSDATSKKLELQPFVASLQQCERKAREDCRVINKEGSDTFDKCISIQVGNKATATPNFAVTCYAKAKTAVTTRERLAITERCRAAIRGACEDAASDLELTNLAARKFESGCIRAGMGDASR